MTLLQDPGTDLFLGHRDSNVADGFDLKPRVLFVYESHDTRWTLARLQEIEAAIGSKDRCTTYNIKL